mgnify:CR=1 FL=1
MFLKNEWYVACRADEITDKPLGRKICNEAMVFFRGPDNAVAAVQDFWATDFEVSGFFHSNTTQILMGETPRNRMSQ